MSGGLFRPKFDIYGPVTLPKAMEYYGKSPESSSSGEKSIDLVNDALSLIVDSVADASVYDNDGDNLIDCVYIIYAGIGQNYRFLRLFDGDGRVGKVDEDGKDAW